MLERFENINDIAQLFIGSLVFLSQKNNKPFNEDFLCSQACEGAAFVKDFDLELNTIHLICPFKITEDIDVIIKSRDIDFCNNYYTDHQYESFKLSYNLYADCITGESFSSTNNGKLSGSYKQKVIRKMN